LLAAKLATPPAVPIVTRPVATVPAAGVPNGVPASVPVPAPASLPVFLPADAPLMDRLQQVAALALEKQSIGVEGFRFASWLVAFYPGGQEIYNYLDERGGTAAVMGFLAMVPEVQARLFDQEYAKRLELWLDDFFSYDPAGGDSQASEDAAETEVVAA
jgi:hypothetical protein